VQGKLRRLKLKLTPPWRKPKPLRWLMRSGCERVERGIIEHNFVKKYFGPFEASYILRNRLIFFCEYPSRY
jgi:hypothetical protein